MNRFVEGQVEAKQRAVCNQILLIDTAIQDMHKVSLLKRFIEYFQYNNNGIRTGVVKVRLSRDRETVVLS